MGFIIVAAIILLIVVPIFTAKSKSTHASLNPTNETVSDLITALNKVLVFTDNLSPEFYNGFRQTFMIVNHSPNVSTQLKIKLRETYIKKHIMLPNHSIIDNYQSVNGNEYTDIVPDDSEFYRKK